MTTQLEAVYEHGLLRPLKPLDLAEGTKLFLVLVEPMSAKLATMREAMNDPLFLADMLEVSEDFKYVDAEERTP